MDRLKKTIQGWTDSSKEDKVVLTSYSYGLIKDHSRVEVLKLLRKLQEVLRIHRRDVAWLGNFNQERENLIQVRHPDEMLRLKFLQTSHTSPPAVPVECDIASVCSSLATDAVSESFSSANTNTIIVAKEPVKPPNKVKSWDDIAKLKLREVYKAYQRKCTRYQQPAVPVVELLSEEIIYKMAEYRFQGDINKVTSDVVQSDIMMAEKQCRTRSKVNILDVIMQQTMFKPSLSDPDSQVEDLIGGVKVVLRMHSMQKWLDNKPNRKKLIKVLMEKIPPAAKAYLEETAESGNLAVTSSLDEFATSLLDGLRTLHKAERLQRRAADQKQKSAPKANKVTTTANEHRDFSSDLEKLNMIKSGIVCVGCYLANRPYQDHFFDKAQSAEKDAVRNVTCSAGRYTPGQKQYLSKLAAEYWLLRKASRRNKQRKARKVKGNQKKTESSVTEALPNSQANLEGARRTLKYQRASRVVKQCAIAIEKPDSKDYEPINAILDSGYTGAVLLPASYLRYATNLISSNTDIRLADDDTTSKAAWEGLVNLDITCGDAKFKLERCPTVFVSGWSTGLVGEEILSRLELLPRQNADHLNGRIIPMQECARSTRCDIS